MTEPYAAHLAPSATWPALGAPGPDRSGWVVFGAGGHASAVVDVLERLGETVVAVVGDPGGRDWHVEVLMADEEAVRLLGRDRLRAALGIGEPELRLSVLAKILAATETDAVPPVVATTATVARDAVLGAGTVVLEHAHIGPGSRLGAGTIVNTGAIVEHDCTVGEGAHIAPGAVLLGGASVGARTLVGSGARVLPSVTVGSDVTAGAGAVVTTAVADGLVVVGAPAASPALRAGADR